MLDGEHSYHGVDNNAGKASAQPELARIEETKFLVAVPQIPVIVIDFFVSKCFLVALELGDWNPAFQNLVWVPMHPVERRCDVSTNEALDDWTTWMLGDEFLDVIPVAIDRDDGVLAVELFVVFRDFGQGVSDVFEIRDVILYRLSVFGILDIVKLMNIVPVKQ